MTKCIVDVFKGKKKVDAYLYVEKGQSFDELPELLIQSMGELSHVMTFVLTEERKLARADAKKVLSELRENKFYLQLPPKDPQIQMAIANN